MKGGYCFGYFSLCFRLTALSGVISLAGCVTPIPLEQEAPDLSYKSTYPIVISIVDERDVLKQGKEPTYIGRAHGAFGIPSDMHTYPWFVTDKGKKKQTLAEAVEERIVFGLNDEGWKMIPSDQAEPTSKAEAKSVLTSNGAHRLLILTITQWFVSVNLNWVTAFNFDWGYRFDVRDEMGDTVSTFSDSGRDVVDEDAKQSPQNTIKMAFRDRLIQILENPQLKSALSQ